MLWKLLVGLVAAVLAMTLPGMAAQKIVHKGDLAVATQDGVSWYTTGIGADTREVIVKGFPLKVIFANKKGELLAAVEVRLMRDDSTAFSAKNVGPWLFVDLPAGTYGLRANVNGLEAKRENIQVPSKGTTILTVHLATKPSGKPAKAAPRRMQKPSLKGKDQI